MHKSLMVPFRVHRTFGPANVLFRMKDRRSILETREEGDAN